MSQVRKDFLVERYAIISEKRGSRPKHFEAKKAEEKPGQTCFFCPGNESLTPPTIEQLPAKGPWKIRVFRNKFPALKPPKGDHEIVVDTPVHNGELQDLKLEELIDVFLMYEKRRKALERRYKHISVFKNMGKEGGASLPHSHTQIVASQFVPPIPAQEERAAKLHYAKWHRCAWCDDLKDMPKNRIAFENEYAIAITANAPRFSYETWIMPKRHCGSFSELTKTEMLAFCDILSKALGKVYSWLGGVSYNFILHTAPKGGSKFCHFHVELMPRVATHAGYELGEGAYIVDVSPETAAKVYRLGETTATN